MFGWCSRQKARDFRTWVFAYLKVNRQQGEKEDTVRSMSILFWICSGCVQRQNYKACPCPNTYGPNCIRIIMGYNFNRLHFIWPIQIILLLWCVILGIILGLFFSHQIPFSHSACRTTKEFYSDEFFDLYQHLWGRLALYYSLVSTCLDLHKEN